MEIVVIAIMLKLFDIISLFFAIFSLLLCRGNCCKCFKVIVVFFLVL